MRDVAKLVVSKLDAGLSAVEALDNLPDSFVSMVAMELIRAGADPIRVLNLASGITITVNLRGLLELGVSADFLASRVDFDNLNTLELLHQYRVNPKILVEQLMEKNDPGLIVEYMKWLYLNGYGDYINIQQLIDAMPVGRLTAALETLLWVQEMDIRLLWKLGSYRVAEHLDLLRDAGFTIEQIIRVLEPHERLAKFDQLVAMGAEIDPNHEIKYLSGELGILKKDTLIAILSYGVKPMDIAQAMSQDCLISSLEILVGYGLPRSYVTFIRLLVPEYIVSHLERLKELGFSLEEFDLCRIIGQVSTECIAKNFRQLLDSGIPIEYLISKVGRPALSIYIQEIAGIDTLMSCEKKLLLKNFSATAIVRNLEFLEKHGFEIDIEKLCLALNDTERNDHFEELYVRKAKFDIIQVVKSFSKLQITHYLSLLLEIGISPDFLVNRAFPHAIFENLDSLLEKGANPNIIALRLHDEDLIEVKDKLLAHGATMWLE